MKGGPSPGKRGRKPGKLSAKNHKDGEENTMEEKLNPAILHHLNAGIIVDHPQLPTPEPGKIKELLTMTSRNYYLSDPALVSMYERKIGVRELQTWLRNSPQQLPAKIIKKMKLNLEKL